MRQHLHVLIVSFVQVFEGLILIAETRVDPGEVIGRDLTVLRQLLLLFEYSQRLFSPTAHRVGVCQHRVSIPSLRRILESYSFSKLRDALFIHTFCQISFTEKKVEVRIIRSPLHSLQI